MKRESLHFFLTPQLQFLKFELEYHLNERSIPSLGSQLSLFCELNPLEGR
jgi:hypothetical protein